MTLLRSIAGALGLVPRWVWILLAVAAAWHFAVSWHAGQVRATIANAKAEQFAADKAAIAKLQGELEAKDRQLADQLRGEHEKDLARIAADADAVRVHGPGKATCTAVNGVPAAAGGSVDADRPADAAVADVRSEQREPLVGLPFAPTVTFAEQHDAFRSEALAWRDWWVRFSAQWQAYRAKALELNGGDNGK